MKRFFFALGLFVFVAGGAPVLDISAAPKEVPEQVGDFNGIRFTQGTWDELLQKAKAENKLIFVDFYTQWCGPCYNMATTVFTLPQVGSFYNKHFVCAKIDAEVGEGIALAKKFKVRSYPTYVFIDPVSNELVHRSGSRQSVEQFLYTGQSAVQPQLRSLYLENEYAKGNREKKFLMNYIRYKHSIYDRKSVEAAFAALIEGGASLKERPVWDIFVEAIPSLSPYLFEVSRHYDEYCALYGKKAVDDKFSKETQYGDLQKIMTLCDFKDKAFNCEMIRISEALYRQHNYDEAIRRIDALIANPAIDQQQLIGRLKFIARVRNYEHDGVPQKWFDKCVEYARYVAYNNADRDDATIHQTYAEALEIVLQRAHQNKPVPECLFAAPEHGRKEYNLRPDALKIKPQYRKTNKK